MAGRHLGKNPRSIHLQSKYAHGHNQRYVYYLMKKIALVTGSYKGLGLAITRRLSSLPDMSVIITSRREAEGLAAKEALAAAGIGVGFHPLDASDPANVTALFAWISEKYGRLDILVNNAGVNPGMDPGEASVLTTSPETMLRTFDGNTITALRVSQAAVPLMLKNGYGRIVNVSTEMASIEGMGSDYYPVSPSYRMSKVGLNALTVLLGRELKDTNVLVNAYSPGWMKTDMGGDSAPFTADDGAEMAVHLATLPDSGSQGGFFAEMRKFGGPIRLEW